MRSILVMLCILISTINARPVLLKSVDWGHSWTNDLPEELEVSGNLNGVDYLHWDDGIGDGLASVYAVGDNGLVLRYHTHGAGNWGILSNIPVSEDLNGISFHHVTTEHSQIEAIIVGDNGSVIVTYNYGIDWNIKDVGTSEDLLSVHWDQSGVWICGKNGTVIHSDDTWSWDILNTPGVGDLYGVGGPYDEQTYICGQDGQILFTDDGLQWDVQNSNTDYSLRSVSTRSSESSTWNFCAGEHATILLASASGWSECPIYGYPDDDLYGIDVAYSYNYPHTVAVGSNGAIFATPTPNPYVFYPVTSGTKRTLNDVAGSGISYWFYVVGDDFVPSSILGDSEFLQTDIAPSSILGDSEFLQTDIVSSSLFGDSESLQTDISPSSTCSISMNYVQNEGIYLISNLNYQTDAEIKILDISGHLVGEIDHQVINPGSNFFSQNMILENCSQLNNGIYYILLSTDYGIYTNSLLILE